MDLNCGAPYLFTEPVAGGDDSLMDDSGGRLSMSDIYCLLLADLGEVSELVDNARSYANENQPRQSCGTYLKINKSGHNNPKTLQSAFKKKILDALNKSVQTTKPLGEPLHTAHVSLELRAKLLQRVIKDRNSIQEMTSQLSQLQDSNKEISRRTEEIKRMIALRTASGEMRTKLKFQEIHAKIVPQRARHVSYIRQVTEKLCPGSDVERILSASLKKLLAGEDPYIFVEEESCEDVEFLLRCNIVSRHPHDQTLIRLRDLL